MKYQDNAPIQKDRCPSKKRKRHWQCTHTEEEPCEDREKRQPFASQQERPWEKPNLPTP